MNKTTFTDIQPKSHRHIWWKSLDMSSGVHLQSPPSPGITAKGILIGSKYQGYANITIQGFGDFISYTTDGKIPACSPTVRPPPASFLLTAYKPLHEVGVVFFVIDYVPKLS
jgi:hypothetical protein